MAEPDNTACETARQSEGREAVLRRFREARAAGLTRVEARLFAESTADVGQLRLLVKGGCPPRVIADIIL